MSISFGVASRRIAGRVAGEALPCVVPALRFSASSPVLSTRAKSSPRSTCTITGVRNAGAVSPGQE